MFRWELLHRKHKGFRTSTATTQLRGGSKPHKKRLPVKLVYYEVFRRVDEAFYREKQLQGWSRKKKEALIKGNGDSLPLLSLAYRDVASRANGDFENLSHR
jgi:putative endonuclease